MILWLWHRLFGPPCPHEWECLGEYTAHRHSDEAVIAFIKSYRCKKCGKGKKYMVGGGTI